MVLYEQSGKHYDIGHSTMDVALRFLGDPDYETYVEDDGSILVFDSSTDSGWNQHWDGIRGKVVHMSRAEWDAAISAHMAKNDEVIFLE